jgi:hypothetical protein
MSVRHSERNTRPRRSGVRPGHDGGGIERAGATPSAPTRRAPARRGRAAPATGCRHRTYRSVPPPRPVRGRVPRRECAGHPRQNRCERAAGLVDRVLRSAYTPITKWGSSQANPVLQSGKPRQFGPEEGPRGRRSERSYRATHPGAHAHLGPRGRSRPRRRGRAPGVVYRRRGRADAAAARSGGPARPASEPAPRRPAWPPGWPPAGRIAGPAVAVPRPGPTPADGRFRRSGWGRLGSPRRRSRRGRAAPPSPRQGLIDVGARGTSRRGRADVIPRPASGRVRPCSTRRRPTPPSARLESRRWPRDRNTTPTDSASAGPTWSLRGLPAERPRPSRKSRVRCPPSRRRGDGSGGRASAADRMCPCRSKRSAFGSG